MQFKEALVPVMAFSSYEGGRNVQLLRGCLCVGLWGAALCPRGWHEADSVPVGGFAIRRGATSPTCLVLGRDSPSEQLWEPEIAQPCSPLLQCHPCGRTSTCEPESWERLAAFLLPPLRSCYSLTEIRTCLN